MPISLFGGKPIVWLSTAKHPRRFEESFGENANTYRNSTEIDIIFRYLLCIDEELKSVVPPGADEKHKVSVGIIAGYSAQKDRIKREFDTIYSSKLVNVKVYINTVDAFQGSECDIIFYSIVRSNRQGRIGFLKDHRRLNVAFSRAMKLLLIVGDHECVKKIQSFEGNPNPFIKVLGFFQRYPQYCTLKEISE